MSCLLGYVMLRRMLHRNSLDFGVAPNDLAHLAHISI